jgi:hypothetical protein
MSRPKRNPTCNCRQCEGNYRAALLSCCGKVTDAIHETVSCKHPDALRNQLAWALFRFPWFGAEVRA